MQPAPPFLRLRLSLWGLLEAAVTLATFGTVAGFLGNWAWWLDLGAHFRPHYAALFTAAAAIYALGGRRRAALYLAGLAALNGALLLPFLPRHAADRDPAHRDARVMLINVNTQHGRPDLVRAAVERERPDLLALEEVDGRWVKALAPLATNFPYRRTEAREDNFGIALWSRLPWKSVETVALGTAEVPSIRALVTIRGRDVCVLATHPLPPGGPEYTRHRNAQLLDIARLVRAQAAPALVVGDLNVSPWSVHFRRLLADSGLMNSSAGRGLHGSWPAWIPLARVPIDHVLHDPRLRVLDKRVGDFVASDHLPVIADLAVDEF